MSGNKLVEYFDPLLSIETNRARLPFTGPGRYYGFDIRTAGSGGLNVTVAHSEFLSYTDNDNLRKSAAALVTTHGLVVVTNDTPNVTLASNSSRMEIVPQYQVFYMSYAWANLEGGVSPLYGVKAPVTVEPKIAPSMAATEIAIGYFTTPYGATSWHETTYTPYPKPSLANEAYARLNYPNHFNKTLSQGYTVLDGDCLVEDTENGPGYYTLTLPNTGNIFAITGLSAGTYNIAKIVTGEGMAGEIIHIALIGTGVTFQFYSGEDLLVTTPWATVVGDGVGSIFTLIKIEGYYRFFSSQTLVESKIASMLSTITALTTAPTWISIITPNTIVNDWIVRYFQRYTDLRGQLHVRALFEANTSLAAALTDLEIGAPIGGPIAIPGGLFTLTYLDYGPIHLILNNTGDYASILHPLLPEGIKYYIPDTIVSTP